MELEQLTILNVVLMLLGMALNILFRLRKVMSKKTETKFSMKYWIRDNWIVVSITILSAVTSLLLAEDLVKMLGVSAADGAPFYKIHAFLSGFVPHVIIDHLKKVIPSKDVS